MKKMFFLSVFLLSAVQLSAQPEFFNDSLRKELAMFLMDINEWLPPRLEENPGYYGPNKISIKNLITNTDVTEVPDTAQYGIYRFGVNLVPQFYHIFFKAKDRYEILEMNARMTSKPFDEILLKLIDYFDRNKDVDRRLLPDYIIAASNVYKSNRKTWDDLTDDY